MNKRLLYFAYGSNMSEARLNERNITFNFNAVGRLTGYKLSFNMRCSDGSAKVNIMESPGDVVWGVLYQIKVEDLRKLDQFEDGYTRKRLKVEKVDGSFKDSFRYNPHEAEVYSSTGLTGDGKVYRDYKNFLVRGALEHRLPSEYIRYLSQIPTKEKL